MIFAFLFPVLFCFSWKSIDSQTVRAKGCLRGGPEPHLSFASLVQSGHWTRPRKRKSFSLGHMVNEGWKEGATFLSVTCIGKGVTFPWLHGFLGRKQVFREAWEWQKVGMRSRRADHSCLGKWSKIKQRPICYILRCWFSSERCKNARPRAMERVTVILFCTPLCRPWRIFTITISLILSSRTHMVGVFIPIFHKIQS